MTRFSMANAFSRPDTINNNNSNNNEDDDDDGNNSGGHLSGDSQGSILNSWASNGKDLHTHTTAQKHTHTHTHTHTHA